MFAVVLGPLSARRHVAAPRGDCRSWSLHGYCACWRTVFHLWWPNGDSFNVTPAVRCWTISLHLFVWKDRFVIPILLVPFKNTHIPVCSNCAPVSVFFSFEQLYCSTVSHHLRVGKNALNKYDQYAIYWGSATPVVFLMIGSGYLRCCDVLRKICHSAQLDDAQSITATNMRKCVSADSIGRETAWMALHEHGPLNTSTLQLCLSC